MDIRGLERRDWPQWCALWQGYLAFYDNELPEAAYTRAFDRMLSGAPGEFHGLVAEGDSGELLGLAHVLLHRHGWTEAPVAYLQDLYTDPAVRGRGVARALITGVYAYADQAGAADVYWLTQEFNAPARRLYDRVAGVTPFIKYSRGAGK